MFGRITLRVSAAILMLFALGMVVGAQDLDDVTVAGKVTDTNGQAVVGATVTATKAETGEERTATTNEDGKYNIVKLKPGVYKIKVVGTGFGIQETPDIPTISAQNLVRDFKLSPADVKAEA